MNCTFEELEAPDKNGKRPVRCKRCGYVLRSFRGYLDNLIRNCDGIPEEMNRNRYNPMLPGDELKNILSALGAVDKDGCNCDDWVGRMNQWGVDGCVAHRHDIIAKLKDSAAHESLAQRIRIGVNAAIYPWFKPFDPYGSIVDEAIRRARAKTAKIEYISSARLIQDTIDHIIPQLPANLSGVCGVPRSGIIPASIIATHLHIPLYTLKDDQIIDIGHGSRGSIFGFPTANKEGKILVIDDTVYSGAAQSLLQNIPNSILAAVYVRPEADFKPEIIGRDLPCPHLLEWNLMNCGPFSGHAFNPLFGEGIACDFDGIFCLDCPYEDADDGPELEKYLDWMRNAKPKYIPRILPVPMIVTGRLEKWRSITEDWLKKWNIKYNRLFMYPGDSAIERNKKGDVPLYKAYHFMKSKCGFFLESSPWEAEIICKESRKPVICPAADRVFQYHELVKQQ